MWNVITLKDHILWWTPPLLSALIGALLHLPTVYNPLVWDDRAAVAYNRDVLGQTSISEMVD